MHFKGWEMSPNPLSQGLVPTPRPILSPKHPSPTEAARQGDHYFGYILHFSHYGAVGSFILRIGCLCFQVCYLQLFATKLYIF